MFAARVARRLLLTALVVTAAWAAVSARAATIQVTIDQMTFNPPKLTVRIGDAEAVPGLTGKAEIHVGHVVAVMPRLQRQAGQVAGHRLAEQGAWRAVEELGRQRVAEADHAVDIKQQRSAAADCRFAGRCGTVVPRSSLVIESCRCTTLTCPGQRCETTRLSREKENDSALLS